ncbi:MAG: hypothetical protein KIT31_18480 [Deltaproteobacteria bacterium]|nr:hypothetical protein [Deltaproteobacteria bacterium]
MKQAHAAPPRAEREAGRARAFYEQVFGWTFTAWGPPGFYQIEGAGTRGALQERRELAQGNIFGAMQYDARAE